MTLRNSLNEKAMQIEKVLINNRSLVSVLSRKIHTPTIYNFTVIYPWIFNSFYCLFCLQTKLYGSVTQKLEQPWMQKC